MCVFVTWICLLKLWGHSRYIPDPNKSNKNMDWIIASRKLCFSRSCDLKLAETNHMDKIRHVPIICSTPKKIGKRQLNWRDNWSCSLWTHRLSSLYLVCRDITQCQYSATVHILISKSSDLMVSHHPPSAVIPNEKKSIANYGILTQKVQWSLPSCYKVSVWCPTNKQK